MTRTTAKIAADERRAHPLRPCGLCGERVRFPGSHVLSDHLPYYADAATIAAALRAERIAR